MVAVWTTNWIKLLFKSGYRWTVHRKMKAGLKPEDLTDHPAGCLPMVFSSIHHFLFWRTKLILLPGCIHPQREVWTQMHPQREPSQTKYSGIIDNFKTLKMKQLYIAFILGLSSLVITSCDEAVNTAVASELLIYLNSPWKGQLKLT